MKSLVEIFLRNLSFSLEKRGLSQTDLAKMAGLKQESISRLMNKARRPNLQTVEKIARALKLKPWELFVDFEVGEVGPLNTEQKALVTEYKRMDPKNQKLLYEIAKGFK